MNTKRFVIYFLIIVVLIVYLFISAPPPIQSDQLNSNSISILDAFKILDHENKTIRSIYTNEIVKPGLKGNIQFKESWKEKDIIAGPLPAQFLRLIARQLEAEKYPMGLFLGSDYPINTANKFSDLQLIYYGNLKKTGKPQFFYIKEIERHIYMSADIAISSACIKCHNKHNDTPKSDWQLKEIMGATTWIYPNAQISHEELIELVKAFRNSVKHAYTKVLHKLKSSDNTILIGNSWPAQGHYLPSLEVLMEKYHQKASHHTLLQVLNINNSHENNES